MTEYRIVEKSGVYRIQYRFLYFFWRWYEESVLGPRFVSDKSYFAPYETCCKDEANKKLLSLRMRSKIKEAVWKVIDK
jgi:hypothetical protein